MARNWIVLTAARAPHAVNTIIAYTEWDDYVALADEVVYSDPVDVDGNKVDALWKVSGTVTLAAGVYTYLDSGMEPTLVNRQRSQVFDAYIYWRRFGRTGHWEGIRRDFVHRVNNIDGIDTRTYPLDATDKWAFHVMALVDHAINGTFPISGALSADALRTLLDHAEFVLRNQGPTWYLAQIGDSKEPTMNAVSYADMSMADGAPIYTDICTVLGVPTTITGAFTPMAVSLRDTFDPEARDLGN